LIDTSSKQSSNRQADQDFLPISIKEDVGRNHEEQINFLDASITIIGIFLAILTISLPSLSILLERPFPNNKGLEINHFLKKDGY